MTFGRNYIQPDPVLSREIFEKYDILLVDVFGVLWNGVDWIAGALDTLEHLVKLGKTVVILSNASVSAKHMLDKYASSGPSLGKHFSGFVTSGEVLNHILKNHKLSFESVPHPKKYAILGTHVVHNFENTLYEYTDSLDESDFVYVSIPQLTNDQKSLLPNELQKMLYRSNMSSSDKIVWDSSSLDPFIPQLKEIFEKKKPLLVANPDKYASVGVLNPENGTEYIKQLVVRQGSLGEAYVKMGGEVLFIGKPYPEVYEFALHFAAKNEHVTFSDLKNKKIAMIGDTLETDILGAQNASKKFGLNVESILTDTGISYRELSEKSVEARREIYKHRGIIPTHEVGSIALDDKVLF